MKPFTTLAYPSSDALTFGRTLHPVRCGFDVTIGGGQVLPEVNFTLPPMHVDGAHLTETLGQSGGSISRAARQAVSAALARPVTRHTPANGIYIAGFVATCTRWA